MVNGRNNSTAVKLQAEFKKINTPGSKRKTNECIKVEGKQEQQINTLHPEY
jgi:hypothetical protein